MSKIPQFRVSWLYDIMIGATIHCLPIHKEKKTILSWITVLCCNGTQNRPTHFGPNEVVLWLFPWKQKSSQQTTSSNTPPPLFFSFLQSAPLHSYPFWSPFSPYLLPFYLHQSVFFLLPIPLLFSPASSSPALWRCQKSGCSRAPSQKANFLALAAAQTSQN